MPLVEALALREMRVQYGDLVLQGGEARFEMLNGLGGESDLGDEDKDRFSAVQTVLGGLEIYFGFPRPGDPVQKDGFRGGGRVFSSGFTVEGGIDGMTDGFVGSTLSLIELVGFALQEFIPGIGIAADFLVPHSDVASFLEGFYAGAH